MWESRLSGSVRGRRATEVWKRSCGTAAKAGGKQRKQTFSCSLGRLLPTRKIRFDSESEVPIQVRWNMNIRNKLNGFIPKLMGFSQSN